MKIKEDIKPISYLKSRSADLISQINETHRPVIITQNGEPRAVIQDAESYEKTINSLNLMRILAHGEKAIQKGDTIKQEDLFKQIDDNLMKRKTHNIEHEKICG
jgi:prevent-host-death family protein